MDWKSPFIVYRVSADGKLSEVFHCDSIKKAKYWLTYIAEPGDVLCRTPVHPQHNKQSKKPEYWSHKEKSGRSTSSQHDWEQFLKSHDLNVQFPEEQLQTPHE